MKFQKKLLFFFKFRVELRYEPDYSITYRVCYCRHRRHHDEEGSCAMEGGPMYVFPSVAYSDDVADVGRPSSFRVACYATDVATYAIHL